MRSSGLRLLVTLCVWVIALIGYADPNPADKQVYSDLISSTSFAQVQKTYKDVSAFGSRLAGSAGEGKTFDYVEARLKALGATNIHRDKFQVSIPDPVASGALKTPGGAAKVYPLWPNLVRTSTCNVEGELFYAGQGTLEELSGHNISGCIVLLEFNSGTNWRNAAKLGAKGIVFIAPRSMPRAQAEAKFSSVPLSVPRFFLPLTEAGPILTSAFRHQPASLACHVAWKPATSWNLTATFAGSDPRLATQPIDLFSYADAMSITPGIAPGAEGIGGIAGMLECARVYTSHPHKRPLLVTLSGAHSLALRGAREFGATALNQGICPLVTLALDLSSGSGSLGEYGRAWFYEARDESKWPIQDLSGRLRKHIDTLAGVEHVDPARLLLVDAVNDGDDRTWKNNIPGKFALDSEPMLLAGMTAMTFRTVEDARESVDTPFDRLDKVRISNVVRQIGTTAAMLHHLLNDPVDRSSQDDDTLPIDGSTSPSRFRLNGGFATLSGQIVSYDPQKSFMPDIPEADSLVTVVGKQKTMMGVRGDMIQFSQGVKADYKFEGLATTNSYADDKFATHLEAFHVEDATGKIDKAVTWQLASFGAFENFFRLTTSSRESPLVVFPCVTVDLYDLVDPQSLTALSMTVPIDPDSGTFPKNYGIFEPPFDNRLTAEAEDTQVAFFPSGQKFQILIGTESDFGRAIVTNSSPGDEKGKGFVAPGGVPFDERSASSVTGVFRNLPLETATDILNINQTRLQRFLKYRIVNGDVQSLEKSGEDELALAKKSVAQTNWQDADRHARAAWGFALRTHPIIMSTANDVVNGVVFYLFLLMPFSYFLERLIFGSRLLTRQLMWSVIFFIASFLLLRIIHPAFELVTNPSMIFIAFVMGALSLIVITFILGKFEGSMREIRSQQVGLHEVDISRASVAAAAFNLGIGNMRRRKARTILTTLTLVVMTFIVLSFTSIVNKLRIDETPSNNVATYPGILVRTPGMDPLQLATYRQIQNEFEGAQVVRRAYYYGADIGTKGILSLRRGDSVAEIRSILGLDAQENQLLKPQDALYAGRWFKRGERNAMILPQSLAETLKIDPTEVGKAQVVYAGIPFTVIGLANESVLRATRDLDGDGMLPPDFSLSKDLQNQRATSNSAFRAFVRLDPSSVAIIPAQTALDLGADLRTLGIHFDDPKRTQVALESLMPRLRLNLYAGVQDGPSPKDLVVKQFSVQEGSQSSGIFMVIVQLVIAAVFVLNTMIASVYERTREIAIFSSIGLAPNHISMLFFAESLVYGVLGAVIGFFAAQISAKIIVSTNSLQGLTLNFSSTSAVLSAALVMAVVVGSTIYPARVAARIAAPAMNDEVFQTEPEDDVWNLPLPFSISAVEAGPIARFLQSWLVAYEGFTIGDFVSADTKLERDGDVYRLSATTWLAPFDLGVSQRLVLTFAPSMVGGVYVLDLELTRLAGDPENWPIVNRRFLATIRKEFLTWRTLTPEQRAPYQKEPTEAPEAVLL